MNLIKSILSVKSIMIFRLVTGMYFDISKNKIVTILAKAYCVLVAIVINVLFYKGYEIRITDPINLFLQHIIFNSNVISNLLSKGEYLFKFLNTISYEDNEIPISRLITILIVLEKITSLVYIGLTNFNVLFLSFITVDMIVHLSNIARIIRFEIFCHRMAELRRNVEEDLSAARRFEDGEEVMMEKLKKCLDDYLRLLDVMNESNGASKFLVGIV